MGKRKIKYTPTTLESFKDHADMNGFLDYLDRIKGLSESSIETYVKYYKFLDPTNITNESMVSFVKAHGNIYAVRGMLKNYLEFRGLHRIIDLPPKPTGSKEKKLIRDISDDKMKLFIESLYAQDFKMGLMAEITVEGALREFEIPTIKINSFLWEQWLVDPTKKLRLIVYGKRKKQRIVLMPPDMGFMLISKLLERNIRWDDAQLKEYITLSEDLLFEGLNKHKIYNIINSKSKQIIGIALRPHELRHFRANQLKRKGADIYDIKNYLGHSSIKTTEIYIQKNETESLEKLDRIA